MITQLHTDVALLVIWSTDTGKKNGTKTNEQQRQRQLTDSKNASRREYSVIKPAVKVITSKPAGCAGGCSENQNEEILRCCLVVSQVQHRLLPVTLQFKTRNAGFPLFFSTSPRLWSLGESLPSVAKTHCWCVLGSPPPPPPTTTPHPTRSFFSSSSLQHLGFN